MAIISLRVSGRERRLSHIREGGLRRLVGPKHLPVQEALKLEAEGLIRIRWCGPWLKRQLRFRESTRVGLARLTPAGRTWLEENAVEPVIHGYVETYSDALRMAHGQ